MLGAASLLTVARNKLQHIAVEKTRLGIPLIFAMDFIHGTRLEFPIAPALAGSFEPELFEKAQAVAAAEARAGKKVCDKGEYTLWIAPDSNSGGSGVKYVCDKVR